MKETTSSSDKPIAKNNIMSHKIISKFKKHIKKMITSKQPPYLIQDNGVITAGRMSYHNGDFIVQGSQKVKIGSFCAFGQNIRIITENHDYNYPVLQYTFYRNYFGKNHPGLLQNPPNKEKTKGPVEIGNDVWIGHNVTILSGVKIGDGASIGVGSLITKDVYPYSIVGGVPAKKIKMRFKDDIIKFLQEIQWWDWKEDKIKKNYHLFYSNLNILNIEELKNLIK